MKKTVAIITICCALSLCSCQNDSNNIVTRQPDRTQTETTEVDISGADVTQESNYIKEDATPYVKIDKDTAGTVISDSAKQKIAESDLPDSVKEEILNNSIKVYTDPRTGSEYWLSEEQIKQIEENGQSVEDTIIIDDELYERLLKIAEEESEYSSEN